MSRVNNQNYYVVQGWMVKDLKLKGLQLQIYAIIYGFSQAENQRFTGSLQYLSDWCGCTKQGAIKALKELAAKGLIDRENRVINGVNFVEYYTTEFNGYATEFNGGGKLSLTGYATEFNEGMQLSLPNKKYPYKIEDNVVDNIDISSISNDILPSATSSTVPEESVFIKLPLISNQDFIISFEKVAELQELYPAIDVEQGLRNMKGWLIANPKNRKTEKGIMRFITGWLSREQDKARPQKQQEESILERIARL